MKTFEYNWATAEMIKMYLKNSRAQGARKARIDAEVSADTQEVPTADSGLTAANSGTAADSSSDIDSSDVETSGGE
jgi:hypothetical protein